MKFVGHYFNLAFPIRFHTSYVTGMTDSSKKNQIIFTDLDTN